MRTIFILSAVAGLLILVGCGSDEESADSKRVVATTGILADIVGNVAGPDLEVEQLIPDGSSPHDFSLSAEDRQGLEQADLIVANGADLEAGLPLDQVDKPRWDLADHVGELLPFEEGGAIHEHAEDEHEEEQGAHDPHVWMDPTRVAGALPSLADALAEIDPEHADDFRRRADAYAGELRSLDHELRGVLDRVPEDDRELVTSHESLGYLADRYGFEVVATAFPSSGPEAEASAAALDEVINAIAEHDVPAVFAQEEDDPEALRLVADEAGVAINEELIIESLGSTSSYEEMLRHDAEQIASALTGD